jgi:hypothetical protein
MVYADMLQQGELEQLVQSRNCGQPAIAWTREAEEPPSLKAVAKERLAKIQKAGKGLADAVVICDLWRLAVAL